MKKVFVCFGGMVFFAIMFAQGISASESIMSMDLEDNEEIQSLQQAFDFDTARNYQEGDYETSPENISDDIKAYVPKEKIITLFCLNAKWKSQKMFSSFSVLREYLLPKIKKLEELDIIPPEIDLDFLEKEAKTKLEAVCDSKEIDEALLAVKDFHNYSNTNLHNRIFRFMGEVMQKMDSLKKEFEEKIKSQVQPFIVEEKAKIQEMQDNDVDNLEESNGDIDKARQELEKNVKEKIEEILGVRAERMKELAQEFSVIGGEIEEEINKISDENEYKKEALIIKKEIILSVLDKKIEQAKARILEIKEGLLEAKESDPLQKNADELFAELDKDKDALIANLHSAVGTVDDIALDKAVGDFENNWKRTQNQAKQGIKKAELICKKSEYQIIKAKNQVKAEINRINGIFSECSGTLDEKCLKIENISDELNSAKEKLIDVLGKINRVGNLCAAVSTETSSEEILTALNFLKTMGEEAELSRDVLLSARDSAVSSGIQKTCLASESKMIQSKKQLQVAFRELDVKIMGCLTSDNSVCDYIQSKKSEISQLRTRLSEFYQKISLSRAMCEGSKSEKSLDNLLTVLMDTEITGTNLRKDFFGFREEVGKEESDTRNVCKASLFRLSIQKSKIMGQYQEVQKINNSCRNNNTQRCQALAGIENILNLYSEKIKDSGGVYSTLQSTCSDDNAEFSDVYPLIAKVDKNFNSLSFFYKEIKDVLKPGVDRLNNINI